MFIRHAEKPDGDNDGIDADGAVNKESLTVRGWQRAGGLVRFFCPRSGSLDLVPQTIFAASAGPEGKSMRPIETVTPLVEFLGPAVTFVKKRGKDDLDQVMDDIAKCDGVVLVSWEHKRIPDLVTRIPNAPKTPPIWPDERFDVVWIFDRKDVTWSFSQLPQQLLAGDRTNVI